MKHTHPNHTSKAINETTGRIVFESSASLVSDKKPEIARYYIDKLRSPNISRGSVLGRESRRTCALVINVRRGDIISIRETIRGLQDYQWRHYRIGDNFQPLALDLTNRRITVDEFVGMTKASDGEDVPQIDLSKKTMREFIAETHPDWLNQILIQQFAHWRTNKPASLFRLAPSHMTESDLRICVRKEPFLALAHSKHRLSKRQLARCVRASLKGAVMYAPEMLTPSQIKESIYEHPKETIRHVWDKLTVEELRLCATNHPYTAFKMRIKMPLEKRAIMLARSYQYSFLADFGKPLAPLHAEIVDSLTHYPDEWLCCHNNDYGQIFRGLKIHVKLEVNAKVCTALLEGMHEDRKELLARFIGRL